jgi:hypothetical protein
VTAWHFCHFYCLSWLKTPFRPKEAERAQKKPKKPKREQITGRFVLGEGITLGDEKQHRAAAHEPP